jgi:hypothetical protein
VQLGTVCCCQPHILCEGQGLQRVVCLGAGGGGVSSSGMCVDTWF